MFSTLQETVVIICVKAHFTLDGGHSIGGTEGVWDEGRTFVAFRHLPLIDGKHDDVAEVEISCFKQSHHLQSHGRFTMKGDACLADLLPNEP